MNMENDNITGKEVLDSIREERRLFHNKARFPNAILIHPNYYSILKDVLNHENSKIHKKIFDLVIYETEDIPSFKLIRTYDRDECSI